MPQQNFRARTTTSVRAPETTRTSEDWRARAACLDVDPETFFPTSYKTVEGRAQVRRAVAVCDSCPVLAECYADVMQDEGARSYQLRHGIRAGTTPWQRHATAVRSGGGAS